MLDPLDREAVLANVALKKSDYRVIIELACIPSAEELLAFKRAYQARYKRSLEEDVASHFSGDMRKVRSNLYHLCFRLEVLNGWGAAKLHDPTYVKSVKPVSF